MIAIILILLAFVALGLARDRLGRSSYFLMALTVIAFVAYNYHHPQ